MSKSRPENIKEIIIYFHEIGGSKEKAYEFYDYHTMCGWVVGKNKKSIKDWKAAARTWMRNEKKWSQGRPMAQSTFMPEPEQPRTVDAQNAFQSLRDAMRRH